MKFVLNIDSNNETKLCGVNNYSPLRDDNMKNFLSLFKGLIVLSKYQIYLKEKLPRLNLKNSVDLGTL